MGEERQQGRRERQRIRGSGIGCVQVGEQQSGGPVKQCTGRGGGASASSRLPVGGRRAQPRPKRRRCASYRLFGLPASGCCTQPKRGHCVDPGGGRGRRWRSSAVSWRRVRPFSAAAAPHEQCRHRRRQCQQLCQLPSRPMRCDQSPVLTFQPAWQPAQHRIAPPTTPLFHSRSTRRSSPQRRGRAQSRRRASPAGAPSWSAGPSKHCRACLARRGGGVRGSA